jgi:hypothetical protein
LPQEFRATPVYVVPIIVSLTVGIVSTLLISLSEVELTSVTVLPETGYGPLFNAAVFVLAAGLGATMIYFLLKKGVHRFIRLLMSVAFSVLSFSLVVLYSELFLLITGLEISFILVFLLACFVSVFVVWQVSFKDGTVHKVVILALGGATGTLLGASIPILSSVLILLLLAVYDVVAVFRGPVGKIAAKGLEYLPGASFSFKDIHVGLGDLTFYSMLVSRMFLSFGWEACVAATLGVLLGAFLSFKMVEKKGMFPGLPFSIVLGLLAALMTSILI